MHSRCNTPSHWASITDLLTCPAWPGLESAQQEAVGATTSGLFVQYSWARQRSQSYSRGQTGDFISLREIISGVLDSVRVTRLCEVCPSTAVMEFKNVVFNAARDGKLRRLKVKMTVIILYSCCLSEEIYLIGLFYNSYWSSLLPVSVGYQPPSCNNNIDSERQHQLFS